MSEPELSHPKIDFTLEYDLSPERQVAEEAFDLLKDKGVPAETRIGSVAWYTNVTERVDMVNESEDDALPATNIGLRLRGVPPLGLDRQAAANDYFVIELQQADTTDATMETQDEELSWKDYVSVIMNIRNYDDVAVVDSRTGVSLTASDLSHVRFILSFMRQECRNQDYEATLAGAAATILSDVRTYVDDTHINFESGDFLELSACGTCGTENIPCAHNPETLN